MQTVRPVASAFLAFSRRDTGRFIKASLAGPRFPDAKEIALRGRCRHAA